MKPAYTTTSFYATILTNVFVIVALIFGKKFTPDPHLLDAAALLAAALGNGIYAAARAHKYAAHVAAVATVQAAHIAAVPPQSLVTPVAVPPMETP